MPKLVTLGNGSVLIGLDKYGLVKDLYFHYAGFENHVSEYLVHKIGVFLDEQFSWLDDGSWQIKCDFEKNTMASNIFVENSRFGISLKFNDIVYNEKNIFIRKITIKNLFDRPRKVRVFFNQQFNIGQTLRGDTAYYDPIDQVVIHYEGRRVFLANAKVGRKGFTDYSTGLFGLEGKEGTFKDAEDGKLEGNPIEHGQVDSVIGVDIDVQAKKDRTFYYWITIGKSIEKVKKLNKYILQRGPEEIITSTKNYWNAWIFNQNFSFYGLGDQIIDLFNKSLVVIRTHVNNNGSILASGDSSMFQFGRDTYSYVWPRDAAFASIALAKAGDFNASRRFFEFCNDVITENGYFMHKYRPDKALGSSWHPWVRDGKPELPIQEDGTALVIYALWTYFELSKDLEFIENIYNSLIKNAAEFMVSYRDEKTGLPKPSYDLWEAKYGISTFTTATVFGALTVAGKFAKRLGKDKSANKYFQTAKEIKEAIIKYLYNDKTGSFYKLINTKNGEILVDETIDMSSVYGIYKFNVLSIDDPRLKKAMRNVLERLELTTEIGGVARFEGDQYLHSGGDIPGNPWFITTQWLTQYYIDLMKNQSDIAEIVKRFTWVVERASPSGILSEQLNAYSGKQLSAAPLIWSHAEYVISIVNYLEKLESLEICKACYPIK